MSVGLQTVQRCSHVVRNEHKTRSVFFRTHQKCDKRTGSAFTTVTVSSPSVRAVRFEIVLLATTSGSPTWFYVSENPLGNVGCSTLAGPDPPKRWISQGLCGSEPLRRSFGSQTTTRNVLVRHRRRATSISQPSLSSCSNTRISRYLPQKLSETRERTRMRTPPSILVRFGSHDTQNDRKAFSDSEKLWPAVFEHHRKHRSGMKPSRS